MADEVNNCHLINAPAGSGKTTLIKSMVRKFLLENPKDNILCITYTNRAADELAVDLKSDHIFIGTIHSFLHSFMRPYFAHSDILKLYFEQRAYLETRLNDRYQKFDNSIENQNKELKILTSKIEKIYQKHGITKEVLKTYYAKKTVRAD